MSGAEQGAWARLRRAFSLGTSQALIRLACSFISIKMTAVYLGPPGLALVAQFNNLVTLGQGLMGAGINTAAVRLSAEYHQQPARRSALLATCLRLALLMGAVGALILLLLARPLAAWLFDDAGYAWAVMLAGVAIAATLVNSLLLGALNGVREIHLVVLSNILASVLGLLAFAPACVLWGIRGGIGGSLATYLLTLGMSAWLSRRSTQLRWRDYAGRIDRIELRRILGYYPMLVAHATLTPLATILVRDAMMSMLSLQAAGLWQGAWRLSEVYTTIITTSVSLYFMPRLGELAQQPAALGREVRRTFLAVTGITAALALGIFLFRELVVYIVFSPAFHDVVKLMPVMLLGDVLKMAAWTLGFVLVATQRTAWYMAIEVLAPAALVLGVHLFTPLLGAVGAMWAYVLSGTLQLLLATVALRRLLLPR